jgi:hypothetical protein
MSNNMFHKDVRWQRNTPESVSSRPYQAMLMPVLGGGAVLALIIALSFLALHSIDRSAGQVTPSPVAPSVVMLPATSLPTCSSAAIYLDAILLHERHGRWEHAASTAELALRTPNLCLEDKEALAGKAIAAGLEVLFATRLPPYVDIAAHQQLVDRYHSLKRQAAASGIPFPTTIQIATRAYSVGQFLLAKTAFEEAFLAGEFTAADQALVQQYTATLFNLGQHWVNAGSSAKDKGFSLLVASHRIDVAYQVGSGAAWGELRRQLGEDETKWPKPAATPLLVIP